MAFVTDIQFTREVEENGKLPFLDCLVSRDDNSLRTTVYRKPTHIDRLLDESYSLSDENKYLDHVFSKNNYNEDFIKRNTYRPTTTTEANANTTPTTTATIPYVKAYLRTSRASYNHLISTSLTNLLPHYVSY